MTAVLSIDRDLLVPDCVPDEVLAEAALAACHAQSAVARVRLGQKTPRCAAPCEGCLEAARAVLEVVSARMANETELRASVTVTPTRD